MVDANTFPLRVCKLGGSLLDQPWISERLQSWLARQTPIRNVLIVGGGMIVDRIRQRWLSGQIDDNAAHWEAIQAMAANAKSCYERGLLPDSAFADRIDQLSQFPQVTPLFVDVTWYLRTADSDFPAGPLPASWDVTSDSIAARVANVLSAEELVLLKSTSAPDSATISSARGANFVDQYFDQAIRGIGAIRWVNLRDEPAREGRLRFG